MNFTQLPCSIILKIIDIPWEKGKDKQIKNEQIKNEYKHKNPYNSLVRVNKEFNKRFSNVDILIPIVGAYSAKSFTNPQLIYIGKQLNIQLDNSFTSYSMKLNIYNTIIKNKISDKGNNSTKRKTEGIRVDWFLRKDRRNKNHLKHLSHK